MDILSSRGNLTEEARYRELRGFSFARRTNSTYNKNISNSLVTSPFSVIICCLIPSQHLPASSLQTLCRRASNSKDVFSVNSHPTPSIFIPDSITFLDSAETRSMLYCSPMRFATPQIYVGAEGWLSNFLHG